MKKLLIACLALLAVANGAAQGPTRKPTPHELQTNHSATYEEMVAYYEALAKEHPSKLKWVAYDNATDIGEPLHLAIISGDGQFSPLSAQRADKRVMLVMNGIHAGEPDGIDASMMLANELLFNPTLANILEHVVVVIIPAFNVDGMINRGCCSRANQNGPAEYGFRANACMLNLNRDFSKMDSRNTQAFARIFHEWNPDLFIDTHTSDGADYPATMTYIQTHPIKFPPVLNEYVSKAFNPDMESNFKSQEAGICPYVNPMDWSAPPDSGISGFMDTPRYSTGYASLFNTIAFTSEAHMLKPFDDRVHATYLYLLNALKFLNRDRSIIARARKEALASVMAQEEFVVRRSLDKARPQPLRFRGYTAFYETSPITGLPMLRYDASRPYEKDIPLYDFWIDEAKVKRPEAYIIPQGWTEVIQRLEWAGVEMKRLSEHQSINVEVYRIESCSTRQQPTEGHYLHYNTKVKKEVMTLPYRKGDYVIYTKQPAIRFIIEMLEPEAEDSYFNWNFFDPIMDRKEYFSPYAWEPQAQKLLEQHPDWKTELDNKKASDPAFAADEYAQLDFIYQKSEWFEPTLKRYPVTRLMAGTKVQLAK